MQHGARGRGRGRGDEQDPSYTVVAGVRTLRRGHLAYAAVLWPLCCLRSGGRVMSASLIGARAGQGQAGGAAAQARYAIM
jgi:hypothetical protein